METFLEMFGGVSVTIAQLVGIGVIIFSVYGSGKKAMEYFAEKKKGIIEKAQAQRDKDDEWQRIANQVAQYPTWHEQSIQIRDELAKSIGALNTKIDQIGESIDQMKLETEENRATTCRYRILRFDDEIRHRDKHTKEHFEQILDDIRLYEDFCERHPKYENSKAEMAIKNIRRTFDRCDEKGVFIYAAGDVPEAANSAFAYEGEGNHA